MSVDSQGGIILTGENRQTLRKTCPSAASFNSNPTSTDPGANTGLRDKKPGTTHLSHDTAYLGFLVLTIHVTEHNI
jgi:hypothetical protein